MALNGTIKVSTEVMIAKAQDVDKRISAVRQQFQEMGELVKRSTAYWNGDAGELHRSTFQEKEPVLTEILQRFQEHSIDLKEMAGNYGQTEETLEEELALELPDSVIE